MLFKKPKKRQPKVNPNAVTVNWIVFGFLILGLSQNYVKHESISSTKTHKELKEAITEAAPTLPIDFSNFQSLLSAPPQEITIKDVKMGRGGPAVCGQEATIAYTARTSDETEIKDSADAEHPLTFKIGEHKVMPAFELGLVGMEKGGKRLIMASGPDAYEAEGFKKEGVPEGARVVFDVDLLDIKPALPDILENVFRISDIQPGYGRYLLCGNLVKVGVTVRDVEGKKLFSSEDEGKPVIFTIGKSEVFLGLEQGVIGMQTRAKRALIVSPAFQKTMNGNDPKLKIPFPPKQSVLVDVEALP